LAGHFQGGSGNRYVPHRAINRHAAKFNPCGFQDAITRRDASFHHSNEIRQIPKESIKPAADKPRWQAVRWPRSTGTTTARKSQAHQRLSQARRSAFSSSGRGVSLIVADLHTLENGWSGAHIRRMQTRCPNCTIMVKSTGSQWIIINGPCPELAGTQWSGRPEFCPTLSQVLEPDVTLPGAWNRVVIQAEIDRIRVLGVHA
jgi:hypothetical protein